MIFCMNTNTFAEFSVCGQPESVLQIATAAITPPQEGEVLVRMKSAPINPADINFIQGVYGIKPTLPHSRAGLEGCGIVAESNSPQFAQGDKVIILNGTGSWCQWLTAPASSLLKIPTEVDSSQAAMLKVNPLTAFRMLTGYVQLNPGEWIIQNAANSGVGRCIIQIAHQMGIKTINVVRRPDVLTEELTALGADIVIGEDAEAIKQLPTMTGGAKPRLASNAVGGDSATRLMDALAPSGTMVTYGAMSKQSIKVPNGFIIFKGITLQGLWVTQWLKSATVQETTAAYSQLASWMQQGKLTQAIDTVYPLRDVAQAAENAQQEFRAGKIVLDLA